MSTLSAAHRISTDSRLDAALADAQPRYFIQFGWTTFDVDTDAIPGRYLRRGEITPCVNYKKKMHLYTIPEGALIRGSEETDKDGKAVYGYVLQPAGPEATRLAENESAADYKQTLFELTALVGMPVEVYRKTDFNALLYPNGIENLPEKHEDVIALLEPRIAEIRRNGLPGDHPPFAAEQILKGLEQVIDAVKYAADVQRSRLDDTHLRFRVQPSDPSGRYKRNYDRMDEEMLKRTGIPRHNEADVTTAKALETLAEQKNSTAGEDLRALIEIQRQQMEMMRAQMEMMQATISQARPSDKPQSQPPNQPKR